MGRIIVASGNAAMREELRTALEFEGHSVTEAATAFAASTSAWLEEA